MAAHQHCEATHADKYAMATGMRRCSEKCCPAYTKPKQPVLIQRRNACVFYGPGCWSPANRAGRVAVAHVICWESSCWTSFSRRRDGKVGVRLGAPGSLARVDALAVGADGTLYLMSEDTLLRLVQ